MLKLLLLIATVSTASEGQKAFETGMAAYLAKNCAKAIPEFKRAGALGSAEAYYQLGAIYLRGQPGCAAKDMVAASKWFTKAAERGHAGAMTNIGFMHEAGMGQPKDLTLAQTWYLKAAMAGDTRGMINLANLLKEPKAKRDWLSKAAVQGDSDGIKALKDLDAKK
jgi:uncharacterized protein